MKRFICILAACVWAGAASAKVADIAYFKLDNGLEVAVIENHKAPVTLQMLYYKTGSADDPKGKGGIAHLLEHLMFRGTLKVPDKEFNRLTDAYGAENNAYTTFGETGYYEFADVSKLELMMALEADRMAGLDISEEAFAAERDIVYEERMQRFESQPVSLFYETMRKMLWQDNPLAQPVSGSPAEIKALTREDAVAFYQKWYKPDNALLVLSGDITPKEAEVLAKKYYGGLEAGGEVKREIPAAGRAGAQEIVMRLKDVQTPRFVSQVRFDAGALSKKEVLALDLLAEYLAGDDTSFLYDELVYEEKLFLGIAAGVDYDALRGGAFSLYATPAEDMGNVAEPARQIKEAMHRGVAELTEEKLTKIKNRLLSGAVYMQEDPEAAARFVGGLLLQGYTADEAAHYDEMIKSVTVEDVQNAWEKVQAATVRLDGYLTGEAQ